MKRTRLGIGAIAGTAAAAAVLFGGVSADRPAAGPTAREPAGAAAGQLLAGFRPGDTAAYVAALERRVEDDPTDARSLTLLGLAYQQRARETGDPTFYPRSARALRGALASDGERFLATTGLAALAAARHDFPAARRLAARARRLSPQSAAPYGVLGDALVELGRYDEAFAAFDRMAALKPSLSSYARVSYARELLGDSEGAIDAMKLAVEAGSNVSEHAAWTLVELGNLYFHTGRLAAAERAYRAALVRLPGYVRAKAALGRVMAARGRTDAAVALLRGAVEAVPLPEYAIALGDVLHTARREPEARKAYALVEAIDRVLRANGVRTELETALFDLDHDRRLGNALARAREAYRVSPSIEAEDVLAWALYKNGRCEDARRHSVRALRLGTRDALKLFHRGMIERCLGNRAEARAFLREALAVNPHFSLLHAPVAREVLA